MFNFGKKRLENRKEIQEFFEEEKYSNKQYLVELQSMLDKLDNIKDNNLKIEIIGKVHRLENIISTISVDLLDKLTRGETEQK